MVGMAWSVVASNYHIIEDNHCCIDLHTHPKDTARNYPTHYQNPYIHLADLHFTSRHPSLSLCSSSPSPSSALLTTCCRFPQDRG